jgi:hypothetical protein
LEVRLKLKLVSVIRGIRVRPNWMSGAYDFIFMPIEIALAAKL